jgi:O-antigen/teichoic acid export membrane protein
VGLVQLKLLVSFLPVQIAGIWILFLSLAAYATLLDLGLSPTLAREIALISGNEWGAPESRRQLADVIKTSSVLFLILGTSAFLIGLFGGSALLYKLGYPSSMIRVWILVSIGTGLNVLGNAPFAVLFGLGQVSKEKLVRSVALLCGLACMALSLFLGFGIVGLALCWIAQGIGARILGWFVLRRFSPQLFLGVVGRAGWNLVKRIGIPSLKTAVVQLGAVLILQTDNLVIAWILGSSVIPKYEAVAKIAAMIMTLGTVGVTASTPYVSRAFRMHRHDEVKLLLSRNLRFIMPGILVLILFFAVNANDVIALWLGPGMYVGNAVLWTLLLMVTLEVHHVIYASALMATGEIAFVWSAVTAGVLNLGLSFFLASRLGLWGVALGTLVAQLLTNNWYAPYVTLKCLGIRPGALWSGAMGKILMFAAAQAAVTLLVSAAVHYVFESHLVFTTVCFVLCLVGGGTLMWLIVMDRRDRTGALRLLSTSGIPLHVTKFSEEHSSVN